MNKSCIVQGLSLGRASQDASSPPRSALFALTCRMQHSCKPNARFLWREDLQREVVLAIRPIAQDDEVTVQYKGNSNYAPHMVRQAQLQELFNFKCACIVCATPPSPERDASDARRLEIAEMLSAVSKVGFDDPQILVRTLELMAAEGLDTPLNRMDVHYVACHLAVRRGAKELGRAEDQLRRAVECAKLCEGVGSQRYLAYEAELAELVEARRLLLGS